MYPSPTYGHEGSEVGVQELPEDDTDADDEDHHLQRQPPRAEHGPPVAILHVLDREIAPAPPASETLSDVVDGRLELHACVRVERRVARPVAGRYGAHRRDRRESACCSAASVCGPTTPTWGNPWEAWNLSTAVCVAGPYSPSGSLVEKPSAASALCRIVTWEPVSPGASTWEGACVGRTGLRGVVGVVTVGAAMAGFVAVETVGAAFVGVERVGISRSRLLKTLKPARIAKRGRGRTRP